MNLESVVLLLFLFFLSLAVGSFLNVVIYRLPRRESLIFPGSHCPVCNKQIKYRDNIPILSYILIGGKCRSCSSKISIIYPLIEFITALMAVILFFKMVFQSISFLILVLQ